MTVATPFLMFEGACEAALTLYVGLIPDSRILSLERHANGAGVQMARASIAGLEIMANDSPISHAFTFTPSTSLFVTCEDKAAFERISAGLAEGGQFLMPPGDYGFSRRFAWMNDRFGVSWQVNLP